MCLENPWESPGSPIHRSISKKCVTASSLCLSLSTNPEFSLSLSHPNTYQIVIVIHQICHKQGQLCLHMPSTDFAHAQLRVNMTQKHNL